MDDSSKLINRCFHRYLIPSVMAILGGNVSVMIDNIIAGNVLGSQALAAMSLVNPVFLVFTTLGTLICAGTSSRGSVSIGRGDRDEVNQYFSLAVILTIIIGVMVSVLGMIFLDDIVSLMGADGELFPLVRDYSMILISSGTIIMAVYLPLNFFRIDGRGNYGMIMFIIMAIGDVILDLLFTLVIPLGMVGLSLATVISSFLGILSVLPFLFCKGGEYHFCLPKGLGKLMRKSLVTGSPLALNNFYNVLSTMALNMILLTAGGSVAVASLAFTNSINIVAQAAISGISQTVSPLVGVFYGEEDKESVKRVVSLALKLGVTIIIGFILLMVSGADLLCRGFGITDGAEIAISAQALRIFALSLLGAMVNSVFVYHYMTIEQTGLSNGITFFRRLGFVVPFAWLLAQIWGVSGVWISFLVSEVVTLGIGVLLAKKKAIKENCDSILLMPKDEYGEMQMISFAAQTDEKSITDSSIKIGAFCERCALGTKQTMMVSLSIEEILLLMVKHMFPPGTKTKIEVKLCVKKDLIILRFRCEGKKFNPIEYYRRQVESDRLEDDEDLMNSLGLKLITKAVKKVDYSTALGINNIIIRI